MGINMLVDTEVDLTRVNFLQAIAGLLVRMCSTAFGTIVTTTGGKSIEGKVGRARESPQYYINTHYYRYSPEDRINTV